MKKIIVKKINMKNGRVIPKSKFDEKRAEKSAEEFIEAISTGKLYKDLRPPQEKKESPFKLVQ